MKKTLLFVMLIVVPIMAMAVPYNWNKYLRQVGDNAKLMEGRAWRMTQRTWLYPNEENWVPQEKILYDYSNQFAMRPYSYTVYGYEFDMEQWIPYMLGSYQYDANGYVQEMEVSYILGDMVIPMSMMTAEYDNQNRLTDVFMYTGDMPFRTWTPVMRMHVLYNGVALSHVITWESGYEEEPASYYKVNFTVDGSGRLVEELEQSSADSLNWVNSSKTVHAYHPADTSTGAQLIEWLAWSLPMSFGMDGPDAHLPGLIAQSTYYDWMNEWVLSDRETNTYSASTPYLMLMNMDEYWQDNIWMQSSKTEYSYDENYNPVQTYNSYWDGDWVPSEMSTIQWEFANTANDDPGAPSISEMNINAYPNPFGKELRIEMETKTMGDISYRIFNTKGQLIRNLESKGTETVWDGRDNQGRSVSNGIYFIRARQQEKQVSARVLLLKQ